MEVNGVKCKECGDIVYSRARHDFRTCSCGKTFVDGGFDYLRYGGEVEEVGKIPIYVTKEELFNDWSKGIDMYGLILASK